MIRPLRSAHRGLFGFLALALPALLLASLAVRREPPRVELPVELEPQGPWTWPATARAQDGGEEPRGEWLLYWCAEFPRDGRLPADAVLQGALPVGARPEPPPDGRVALLYDLVEGRLVEPTRAPLPGASGAASGSGENPR